MGARRFRDAAILSVVLQYVVSTMGASLIRSNRVVVEIRLLHFAIL